MLSFPSTVRIFLCRTSTDLRYSFDRLMGLAQQVFEQDPLSGHLFLFVNRRRDRIKLLYWGGTGFCIWYQQLEKGGYQLPEAATANEREGIEITASQLSLILDGIDLSSVRQRPRYRLSADRRAAKQAVPASS